MSHLKPFEQCTEPVHIVETIYFDQGDGLNLWCGGSGGNWVSLLELEIHTRNFANVTCEGCRDEYALFLLGKLP